MDPVGNRLWDSHRAIRPFVHLFRSIHFDDSWFIAESVAYERGRVAPERRQLLGREVLFERH